MADDTAQDAPPKKSAYLKLRPRLRRFVDAYVETGVGVKAMKRIGFKGKRADVAASKLLAKPEVWDAVVERDEEAAERAGITKTLIYTQLRHVATFDHRALFDESGNPLPIHQLPEDVAAGLASTKVEELFEGRGESREQVGRIHEYRSWPKVEALRTLAQMRKLLAQQHELTGKNGESLRQPVLVVSAEESAALDRKLDSEV